MLTPETNLCVTVQAAMGDGCGKGKKLPDYLPRTWFSWMGIVLSLQPQFGRHLRLVLTPHSNTESGEAMDGRLLDVDVVSHCLINLPHGGSFNNQPVLTHKQLEPSIMHAAFEDSQLGTCKLSRTPGAYGELLVVLGARAMPGLGLRFPASNSGLFIPTRMAPSHVPGLVPFHNAKYE